MDDLLSEFICETNESLATLDVELVRLESAAGDPDILGSIFRMMHTLKGTCGFLGLARLEAVAHAGENVLGKFRDGALPVTPAAVSVILKCIDRIRWLLEAIEKTCSEPEGNDDDLIAEIDAMADVALQSGRGGNPDQAGAMNPECAPAAVELLAQVARAVNDEETAVPSAVPPAVPAHTAETEGDEPVQQHKDAAAGTSSIRVNVDIIENLMTLVSELVLTRNQLLQMQRALRGNEFKVPLQRLTHITADLQDGITRMRMQPIGNAWAKLPRIVRDLSCESGKKIQLVTHGAETELDRQVLEMIKDPLTHMVRNAADHGIEEPAARIAAGKPENGTITLSAHHESGHIFVRVQDDGRGLDLARIKQRILAQRLATESELAAMSEQRICQFIYKPGFSTAEKVTNVSGRGVGMDVVCANIARIGGTVDLTSHEGQGTTFVIKIPLTLAIVSALIIETAVQRFAIPQVNVLELVALSERDGAKIERVNSAQVLRLRDRLLPLVSLRTLLKFDGGVGEQPKQQFVIVAQVGTSTFGIIVDRVFDTEEIVVKPVAPILRGTPYYAGNTILGDGSVILILDPNRLAVAAGQGQLGTEASEAANDTKAHVVSGASDQSSFLLFRTEKTELKAVPLELVARIEKIDSAAIEQVNSRHVVQYREHLMPLVPFDDDWTWHKSGTQTVLVFTDNERSMGLAVKEVVDIVSAHMTVELAAEQPGLIGSAVIDSKATDIVDISHYLMLAFGDWFDAVQEKKNQAGSRNALVVDDSPFFRNIVAPLLAAANWHVTTAANGSEAIALRDAGKKFDVIISDIDMPVMDGLSLARTARNDPRWRETPMIALSSYASDEDRRAGEDAGFDDYLGKSDRVQLSKSLMSIVSKFSRNDGTVRRKVS